MFIVSEIQGTNPNGIPSPFIETKQSNPEIEKRMDALSLILEKLNLDYEVKSGNELVLITSKPTVEMEIFTKIYGSPNK